MLPKINDSTWPVLVIKYPASMTMQDIEAYCAQLEAYGKRGPYAAVVDIGGVDAGAAAPSLRKRLADGVATLSRRGIIVGEAVVIDSVIKRGLFTAYVWARGKAAHPIRAFATVDGARTWAAEVMRQLNRATASPAP
jgi:hypothetical protein